MRALLFLLALFSIENPIGCGRRAVANLFEYSEEHLLCKSFNLSEYFQCKTVVPEYLKSRNYKSLSQISTHLKGANLKEFCGVVEAIIEKDWDNPTAQSLFDGINAYCNAYITEYAEQGEALDSKTKRKFRFGLMKYSLLYSDIFWWRTVLNKSSQEIINIFIFIMDMVQYPTYVGYIDDYKRWASTVDKSNTCASINVGAVFFFFNTFDKTHREDGLTQTDRFEFYDIICHAKSGWDLRTIDIAFSKESVVGALNKIQAKSMARHLLEGIPDFLILTKSKKELVSMKILVKYVTLTDDDEELKSLFYALDSALRLVLSEGAFDFIVTECARSGIPKTKTYAGLKVISDISQSKLHLFISTDLNQRVKVIIETVDTFKMHMYNPAKMNDVVFALVYFGMASYWDGNIMSELLIEYGDII